VAVSSILTSVFSFFNLGLLFFYDLRLAGVAALLMGIALFATGLTVYLQLRYQRTVYQVQGKIAGMVLQFITGIARLRVAGAEDRALAIWARDFSTQKRSAFEARSVANHFTVFNSVLPVAAAMAIFATVAALQDRGLSGGTFLAFNAAFVQLLAATLSLSTALDAVIRAVSLFERIKPILESLPEVHAAMSDPGELSGEIEIRQPGPFGGGGSDQSPPSATHENALYAGERPAAPGGTSAAPPLRPAARNYLVIPGCCLVPEDTQEVPSQRDGELLVVGRELQPEEPLRWRRQHAAVLDSRAGERTSGSAPV
jgi:ABC-type multidrug transport system fused ATPase/permease subunit